MSAVNIVTGETIWTKKTSLRPSRYGYGFEVFDHHVFVIGEDWEHETPLWERKTLLYVYDSTSGKEIKSKIIRRIESREEYNLIALGKHANKYIIYKNLFVHAFMGNSASFIKLYKIEADSSSTNLNFIDNLLVEPKWESRINNDLKQLTVNDEYTFALIENGDGNFITQAFDNLSGGLRWKLSHMITQRNHKRETDDWICTAGNFLVVYTQNCSGLFGFDLKVFDD